MGKSLPTGSTSTLAVAAAEQATDYKGQKPKKLREIIMHPEKLEGAYQTHRPKINLTGNEDNNVLECKANRVTKRCSEKDKILPSDIEQESQFLFSCK